MGKGGTLFRILMGKPSIKGLMVGREVGVQNNQQYSEFEIWENVDGAGYGYDGMEKCGFRGL